LMGMRMLHSRATKNNWNRNFRRAMMTIITTMIMIM
jgi:hypothetical protein